MNDLTDLQKMNYLEFVQSVQHACEKYQIKIKVATIKLCYSQLLGQLTLCGDDLSTLKWIESN